MTAPEIVRAHTDCDRRLPEVLDHVDQAVSERNLRRFVAGDRPRLAVAQDASGQLRTATAPGLEDEAMLPADAEDRPIGAGEVVIVDRRVAAAVPQIDVDAEVRVPRHRDGGVTELTEGIALPGGVVRLEQPAKEGLAIRLHGHGGQAFPADPGERIQ